MSAILYPFWDSEHRRLRALWRLVIHVLFVAVLLILSGLVIAIPIALASGALSSGGSFQAAMRQASQQLGQNLLASAAEAFIGFVGASWLAARLLDRRRFADLGFHFRREWWLDLGFGLALGAALMGLIFAVERAAGWLTITGAFFPGNTGVAFPLAIVMQAISMVGVGIQEETVFRGYQLKNIAEGLRLGPVSPRAAAILGWLLSSVIFGLAHANNPNASPVAVFNIFIAGLFLGIGLLLTGDLAIGIGLHAAWNFFEGNVFGFPDSGTGVGAAPTFITITQGGPTLWTGGGFGPEAGLIVFLAFLVGTALMIAWVRCRRGKLAIFEPLAEPPARPALAAGPAPDAA